MFNTNNIKDIILVTETNFEYYEGHSGGIYGINRLVTLEEKTKLSTVLKELYEDESTENWGIDDIIETAMDKVFGHDNWTSLLYHDVSF